MTSAMFLGTLTYDGEMVQYCGLGSVGRRICIKNGW